MPPVWIKTYRNMKQIGEAQVQGERQNEEKQRYGQCQQQLGLQLHSNEEHLQFF